ncbi:MAG: Translation initiation factor IF-2 [Alphaproteobacteria bacterium MarineAlpha9_Bin4]|nr:translation initiation factor IF-2 [Pelagibacterales bacterium]PPR26589.1 MAG: Translation initiation factor IF-2 [Alphaproteobacteria bacterium MarineAlpha9_Bin4]
MDKKKLGLINKNKLELRKTVGSGTVKQSFSHGRVKSVAVEVKKVRTFSKNNDSKNEAPKETVALNRENSYLEENNKKDISDKTQERSTKDKLEKIKEAAHSSKIDRENKISSRQETDFKNKQYQNQKIKDKASDENQLKNKKYQNNNLERIPSNIDSEPKREDTTKKASSKKQRADLKKQLSLGKGNTRRQAGKMTVQQAYEDEERQRSLASIRRAREKEKKSLEEKTIGENVNKPIVREVKVPEFITVQELANRMAARVAEVIKVLIKNDIAATATQTIDADTAELVVLEFGHKTKRVSEADIEIGLDVSKEDKKDAVSRPPIVTVMGHVDHGKTTLLDAIRNTDVVTKEHGGITQHIGAYQVTTKDKKKVTFIDTPGHSAFSAMRARGAKLTDIVVLVVAADDGVMPQTEEAIKHAKAASVPMIVAINKIDSNGADPNKVKNELLKYDVLVESLGGNVPSIEVSALKKTNLDALLENIILLSEIIETKASLTQRGEGTIIEAKREQGRGVVASVVQQRGILKKGDIVVAGSQWGKIRAIINEKGDSLSNLNPSEPSEILGLNDVPQAGDDIIVVDNESRAREVSEYRKSIVKKEKTTILSRANSMENILKTIKSGEKKILNVIVKADALGSKEAIVNSLEKIGNDEVDVQILLSGVGGITETDVVLAASNEAFIIGFNVRSDLQAKKSAKQHNINIKYYSIIYEIFDEVRGLLSGMLPPTEKEKFLGTAEIKKVFKISKLGKVAGCFVKEGIIKRTSKIRLLRDSIVIHSGDLETLKRHSDEAKEVSEGMECGIAIKDYKDLQVNDVIECYEIESTPRKLEEN